MLFWQDMSKGLDVGFPMYHVRTLQITTAFQRGGKLAPLVPGCLASLFIMVAQESPARLEQKLMSLQEENALLKAKLSRSTESTSEASRRYVEHAYICGE